MKISILTLFPEMFAGPFQSSIIKHAQEKGLVTIEFINIRDFGIGKHKLIDDTPYGGGIGMVMRVDVIHEAISKTKCQLRSNRSQTSNVKCNERVILLTAAGKQFKQPMAIEFSHLDHLILICGHYEGLDERIKHFIDAELSVGDFIVTGGEIPAMLITDAVIRLLPEVLKPGATERESFSFQPGDKPLLEYPQYTRPVEFKGFAVPEILRSGNHSEIEKWRQNKALEKTRIVRPDLLT